ncbi:MAG: BspA family leucine-rich repeat surface protein, partial [Clostridia bacterium]|nr:BspA family leucine-rich repeat surface protein [Clostridia bacterium]
MEQRRCLGCMKLTDQPVCPHCGYPQTASNEPHQLPAGTVLQGQYLVGRVLGQGGFGITYLGWDLSLERLVAIKEFFPAATVNRDVNISRNVRVNSTHMAESFGASRERFLREARALAKLTDVPEIVGIYSSFQEHNTAYIVMEFVKGTELVKMVQTRGGRLGAQETLKMLKSVVYALDTVHKAGLVHRDISPDNIILHPTGGAKILDFGAVRAVEAPNAEQDLNRSTEAIVKHGFAPVEQYRSRGGIGPWTDEYALCGTIYYCLTGRVPVDAVSRSMGEGHPDWQSIPGLTDRQRAALEKGMSILAKDRFQSVAELAAELYAEEDTGAQPVTQAAAAPQYAAQAVPQSAPQYVPQAVPQSAPQYVPQPAAQPVPQYIPQPTPETPAARPPKQKKEKKPVNKKLIGLIAAISAAVLAIAGVVVFFLVTHTVFTPFANKNGSASLMYNPLTRLRGIERAAIKSVTFRDSLDGAPLFATDVSGIDDRSVLMWTEGKDVYIAADGTIEASSCFFMFLNCSALEEVSFGGNLDTSDTQSFTSMFENCSSLTEVDLENLDTSYGHGFSGMFQGCRVLTEVDVDGWDMSRAQNMSTMFQDCVSLRSIPLAGWDTSSVTDMYRLFMNCSSLTEL